MSGPNIVVNLYRAEWFASRPGGKACGARTPTRSVTSWEPLPDLERVESDGLVVSREGGTVPVATFGVLGGALRRGEIAGQVLLASLHHKYIPPEDVRILIRQGSVDIWDLPASRAGEAAPVPPPPGAEPAPAPEPRLTIVRDFRPPAGPIEPTHQLSMFGD